MTYIYIYIYINSFEESLNNLGKVLTRCQETNLYLSHEKCHMILAQEIVFGHHISPTRIKVDQPK
jgi:hypothetical protein